MRLFVGHSLGGKVLLELLRSHPSVFARGSQVWVLDSSPGSRDTDAHGVQEVLDTVRALPERFASRKSLVDELVDTHKMSLPLAQWLGTSLAPAPGARPTDELEWLFDIEGAQALYDSYLRADLWAVAREPPTGVEVHVVRATRSAAWADAHAMEQFRALEREGRGHVVEAGHWLNVDNLHGLVAAMLPHLKRLLIDDVKTSPEG